MKFVKVLIVWILGQNCFSQNKTVCISIDDLPVVNYGNTSPEFHLKLTEKLLSGLAKHKVQAIGFVNEGKMYDDKNVLLPYQKACLEMWLQSGMDLGNHTLRHRDFNTTDFSLFTSDIISGEKQTKALLTQYGKEMKYFRHPFLHVGATQPRADSLSVFLEKQKYTVAPVTIDNDDYLFANAYRKALKKGADSLARQIGEEYLSYMERKLKFYEKQSEALFGRQIPQILLIHASELNSDYILKLLDIFQRNNYQFVSMEEALKDKAYDTPISKYGKYGISWIDRWALSAGKSGDFFDGDPETPKYISDLSNQ